MTIDVLCVTAESAEHVGVAIDGDSERMQVQAERQMVAVWAARLCSPFRPECSRTDNDG